MLYRYKVLYSTVALPIHLFRTFSSDILQEYDVVYFKCRRLRTFGNCHSGGVKTEPKREPSTPIFRRIYTSTRTMMASPQAYSVLFLRKQEMVCGLVSLDNLPCVGERRFSRTTVSIRYSLFADYAVSISYYPGRTGKEAECCLSNFRPTTIYASSPECLVRIMIVLTVFRLVWCVPVVLALLEF
jgi:hypothetical protein